MRAVFDLGGKGSSSRKTDGASMSDVLMLSSHAGAILNVAVSPQAADAVSPMLRTFTSVGT